MVRFDRDAGVSVDLDSATSGLRGEPADWLPAVAGLHGPHECDGAVRVVGVRFLARFTTSSPIRNDEVTSRPLHARFRGGRGDRPLAMLDGEVTLGPGQDHTVVVRYKGHGRAAGRGPNWLMGQALVRPAAGAIVAAIAGRLARLGVDDG